MKNETEKKFSKTQQQQQQIWKLSCNSFLIPFLFHVNFCTGQVRLANSLVSYETVAGRVEVLLDDQWGTVCGKNFGLPDANVLCRELGYGSTRHVLLNSYFGSGRWSEPIWSSNRACIGYEANISECLRNESDSSCNHTDDVSVVCSK